MYHHENRDPSRFGYSEQHSINNGSRFAWTKVLKLRSEVTEQKKINIRELCSEVTERKITKFVSC